MLDERVCVLCMDRQTEMNGRTDNGVGMSKDRLAAMSTDKQRGMWTKRQVVRVRTDGCGLVQTD